MYNFGASHIISGPFGDISLSGTRWKETWILFPRRCIFTHKWIRPFSTVVRGERTAVDGVATSTFKYWTTPKEFTVQSLKGKT